LILDNMSDSSVLCRHKLLSSSDAANDILFHCCLTLCAEVWGT